MEASESNIGELTKIGDEFHNILKSRDSGYSKKINYFISQNEQKNYQATIMSINKYFSLKNYFENVIGGEKFARSALEIGVSEIFLETK